MMRHLPRCRRQNALSQNWQRSLCFAKFSSCHAVSPASASSDRVWCLCKPYTHRAAAIHGHHSTCLLSAQSACSAQPVRGRVSGEREACGHTPTQGTPLQHLSGTRDPLREVFTSAPRSISFANRPGETEREISPVGSTVKSMSCSWMRTVGSALWLVCSVECG